jgi:LDH2 family malate/lactate/ureidoglycolate dehydrogenase
LIPGELEFRKTLERKQNGIELPAKVVKELYEMGKRYSVDLTEAAFTGNETYPHKEAIN